MIKEEQWRNIQLGEVLELIRNGYSGKQVNYITEFPVSRIETISDGKIDLSKVGFVEKIPESYLLNEGDMLFSNINSIKHIGKIAYVKEGLKLYHGMNLLIFRISHGVNSKFLYYKLVQSKQWFEKMAAQAVNQASINQEEIKKCPIIIPNLFDEQSKIAEILETVDSAIEKTEELIAKQVRIKTGLMQDLLTKGIDENGNIRSEETHEFKDSSVGRIPVEWHIRTINDLATHVGSGVTPKGGESVYQKEGILFIRSQNVHYSGLDLSDIAYISNEIHNTMKRSEIFVNDILLNITGASIGRCCIVPKFEGEMNVNQHVCSIRLYDSNLYNSGYVSIVLESVIGKKQIMQYNSGGNREGLNYENIRSFNIPWPIEEERKNIFKIMDEINQSIETEKKQLSKYKRLKLALMQDLLTGKKRVTSLLDDLEVVS